MVRRRGGALLALFFDALLFVASGIQIEGEVRPLVPGREGDGLAQGKAHGVNDALAAGLGGAHADAWGPAGGAHYVGGRGKIHGLSMLDDPLPDDVLELWGDLQPGQILMVITQGRVSIRRGGATLLCSPANDSCWKGNGSPPCYSSQSGRCWLDLVLWSSPNSRRSPVVIGSCGTHQTCKYAYKELLRSDQSCWSMGRRAEHLSVSWLHFRQSPLQQVCQLTGSRAQKCK